MNGKEAINFLGNLNLGDNSYETSKCDLLKNVYKKEYDVIKQDLELLNKLQQVWHNEEWCEGVSFDHISLKNLFNYNEQLFEDNLALDKKNLELEKVIEWFKEFLHFEFGENEIFVMFKTATQDYTNIDCNDKQEYEILKEVLGK